MAKSAVDDIIDSIQRRADYVPSTADSGLDTLTLDILNDSLKQVYQNLFDANRLIDAGQSVTLTTTADQPYIDISTTLATADSILKVTERVNDTDIELISYAQFRATWVNPTRSTSTTPSQCAIFNDRLYLGPTPSATGTSIYVEFVASPTKVVAGETLPYKDKYDPLLIAMGVAELLPITDSNNVARLQLADANVKRLIKDLITNAASNFVSQGSQSRDGSASLGPRRVIN